MHKNILPPDKIKLAFFDLDETITCKDTDFLWASWRSRRSPLGWMDLLGLLKINRLYYSHRLTAAEYGAYHFKRASSMTPERYRKMAASFAASAAKRYVYPEMRTLLDDNRKRGIRNVLITAQDEIIGSAFSSLLNMDDCLASRYVIETGRFTGMEQPLCFQEGKVHWASQYLEKMNFVWEDCAFYSDSLNDRPLLEACAYPVAVHPGAELSALAAEKQWPVFKPEKP
ncbi:MAG: HAD-IB family phosphatase [Spirochaetales bacterium]|nr:HAD-IB family phosphatase [Spirochaetales bacterium]